MISFKTITVEDKARIEKLLGSISSRQQNHCFPVMYLYRDTYHTRIAEYNGFLLVQMRYLDRSCFFFPVGEGDPSEAIRALIRSAEVSGTEVRMIKLTAGQKDFLESAFPGRFSFEYSRGDFEYLYRTEKLQTLSGKGLQSKRNHINALVKHHQWSYESVESKNIGECNAFISQWTQHFIGRSRELSDSGTYDVIALEHAMEEFSDLALLGGLIRVDGKVSALAVGCPVGTETLNVLFERADPSLRGIYPLICQQFALHAGAIYSFMNRGEDLNDEGLRRSKLSWQPDELLELAEACLI